MKKDNLKNKKKKGVKGTIIPIKQPSELSDFVEHELPKEEEVKKFDSYLKGRMEKSSVATSLSEIYQDDSGERVNVKEVSIKKKRAWWLRLLLWIVYLSLLGALVFFGYRWLMDRLPASSDLEFSIEAPDNLLVNEPFDYVITYRNRENVSLSNATVQVVLPDNFILDDLTPSAGIPLSWSFEEISPWAEGKITLSGRLISRPGESNVINAEMTYQPVGISSVFKKSAFKDIILTSSGYDLALTAPGSLLVNQNDSLGFKISPREEKFVDNFFVSVFAPDYIALSSGELSSGIKEVSTGRWSASGTQGDQQMIVNLRASDRKEEPVQVIVRLEYLDPSSDKTFIFEERNTSLEVINNSLNLTLSANGKSAQQGVNYGENIDYVISFANRGERAVEDIIIMAVLEGDAVNWNNLGDSSNGAISGQTIVWTKNEIPELASLAKGRQGQIAFSVPIRPIHEQPLINQRQIKSYAQFSVGGNPIDLSGDTSASRSNLLVLDLNSDVLLDEAVRYFDEDNMAVGTGPIPPKVGDRTTLKVYWTVTNSLHELGDVSVSTKLPNYVTWDGKDMVQAGSIDYNPETNTVTWRLGRMPVSARSLRAEFSVAFTPTVSDRNTVMVITSGTALTGTDNQTGHVFTQVQKAQTTKLEKDDISDTDGIVQ